jgi:HK97 family phage major capsid protein
MDETLKKELMTAVDASIKANLAEIVGKEVADKVNETVSRMRIHSAIEGRDITGIDPETKLKFVQDIRSITRGEKAAYLESSDQTGGYLVPVEVHAGILRIAETVGLITRDARRWAMGSDQLEIPRYTGSVMQGEYVGEDDEGDETQNDIGLARLNAKVWMTIFRIGNTLLADANVGVADWLMAMAAEGFAYRLDREGFVGGTYAGSPFVGMLASPDVTTQTLATGATGFEDLSLEEASTAIGTVPTAALSDAAFYFHRTVWAKIRVQKSGDNYVYGQSNLASLRRENGIQPVGVILDYPVYTTDVLPAYSASAISTKFGVFGNLKLALAWGDRGPMEIAKSTDATVGGKSLFRANQTGIRFTHRHAVSIQLPAAAVVLKTAAA